jgi:hypothetical protein
MVKYLKNPREVILAGIKLFLTGFVVGLPLGIYLLGKGEADARYSAPILTGLLIVCQVMLYAGPLLVLGGLLWAVVKRLRRS